MTIALTCHNCGYEATFEDTDEALDNGWWQDDNGNWYDEECHVSCIYCDSELPISEAEYSRIIEGDVCHHCAEQHCTRCRVCGCLAEEDQLTTVIDEEINREILICEECFRDLRERGTIEIDEGQFHYYPSRTNQNNGLQQDLHPEVWKEIRECPDCRENGERCPKCLRKEAAEKELEQTTLWLYDIRPRPYHDVNHRKFKNTKYKEKHENPFLYYGIENEVLFNSNEPIQKIVEEYIKATGGLFVAEFDRSVTDQGNGIEFISRALSYKKWMSEEVYQLLEAGNKVLQKYKAYNPQPITCGLHVHMSLKFFERNTKKSVKQIKSDMDWIFQIFQPEIEKLSRRKYTKYCASKKFRAREWLSQGRFNDLGFNLKAKMIIEKGDLTQSMGAGPTHHDAVIQTQKTIEARTFNSTIKTDEILGTIEFCRAIAHAARNMKMDKKTTLGDILWCKDSKYLPKLIKDTKVNTDKTFDQKLEVKL